MSGARSGRRWIGILVVLSIAVVLIAILIVPSI